MPYAYWVIHQPKCQGQGGRRKTTGSPSKSLALPNTDTEQRQLRTCQSYCSIKCSINYQSVNTNGVKVTRGDSQRNSRKISSLLQKLVKGHSRPVGLGHSDGLQDKIPEYAHSIVTSQSGGVLLTRTESYKRGDKQNAIQRGHNRTTPEGSKPWVLLEPIPCSQEGRGHEASYKLEEPQQVCGPTTLQDGRDPHIKGTLEKGRLDDKDRSEGRLLHDTDPQREPISSSILCRARPPALLVLLPAIRPVMRSLGLYQDPKASTNPTQRVRDKASGIHRQYTRLGGDRRDREESYLRVNIPIGKPGLHSTPRKNCDNPIPGDRILRDDGRFQNNGTTITRSEAEKTSSRGGKDQRSTSHTLSSRSVMPIGQIQLGDTSSSTEPTCFTERYRETWP